MTGMRPPERLAAVDEANLVLDHVGQVNVFLAAGVLDAEGFSASGPQPDLRMLRAAVGSRVSMLPELRRAAERSGRVHRWVEVAPHLEHHVRLVDPIDSLDGLERMCAELMTAPLPRDRPLWELLIVPWPAAQTSAFILRIHHAIADGMAAVAIVNRLMDPSVGAEDVRPAGEADHAAAAAPAVIARRRSVVARIGFGMRRIMVTVAGRAIADTALLGPRAEQRGVHFLDVGLAELEAGVSARGATVNDALLAATAAGYRALFTTLGEAIPESLPVSVPVALRRHGTSRNQVGVMLIELPLGALDDFDRLRLITEQTRREKARARDQGTLELMRGPVGARIMDRVAHRQHLVAGFVTNVPGPRRGLHLAGASVARIWPVPVLAANVRLGVAAVSYAGRLYCTVHYDADNIPGTRFADALAGALVELSR